MACYAAVLSLLHTLNHIKKHPRPPISLDQNQVYSLAQNLTYFQHFLERYSSEEDEDLERRISAAAYAAEDVIETHIVDQIGDVGSTSEHGEHISSVDLHGGLERVIQDMDLIKREVLEIIPEKIMKAHDHGDQLRANSSISTASTWPSSTTPVFDDAVINEVLDKLTGQQSSLQIIPITGMGGIGKTTFATYIYGNPLIVGNFDTLAWVTISQEYSVPEILRQVLGQGNKEMEVKENELGERVHKKLWGRRYFIVMDDLWSVEALDEVRCFFPDNNSGSRIMITTRLSSLAFELSSSHVFQMKFLDDVESWNLLRRTVFGKELGCPIELENIGKEIAKNSRGLPLSIVVIGGLLAKSNRTLAHWEYTLQNLNSLINLEDGEYCLQILRMSYKELPMHLKPCFLYMGIFREDHGIRVTKLIELWVAEGILRPTKDKRFEEAAEEYINELIDRNLILVDKLRWNGKAKVCKIHDLLRDLCLREAQRQRFLCVLNHQQGVDIPKCMNMERRICIHHNTKEDFPPALESASLTRSLISTIGIPELVQSLSLRLLRVYSGDHDFHCGLATVEAIFKKVNLRLLTIALRLPKLTSFPSSRFSLWNLQTLKVAIPSSWGSIIAPSVIWEMPLLRHVVINGLELPDPLCGENDLILEDLLTLSCVRNLKFNAAVIKRIPNIKILKLKFKMSCGEAEYHELGLDNLSHLIKLQSLNLFFDPTGYLEVGILQCYLVQNLSLPHSLKKLTLGGTMLNWEECATKIGPLPLLEFLRLDYNACCGEEWETVEGQFCSLRFLQIGCYDLRYWSTEDTHFPCLERLELRFLQVLEEIPSSIGDIPTLKSIWLFSCSKSAEDSARGIQVELENTDLKVHIFAAGGQILTASDAKYSAAEEINDTFKYHREEYDGFVDILNDHKAQRIDDDGLIHRVKVLFKGNPNLILWFNKFFHGLYELPTLMRKRLHKFREQDKRHVQF